MKNFILIALMVSVFTTTSAFAVETNTECPMMAQARKNAKANIDKSKQFRRNIRGKKGNAA